jgi:ethanolamine utilization protein EutA (predicted chaperonin)
MVVDHAASRRSPISKNRLEALAQFRRSAAASSADGGAPPSIAAGAALIASTCLRRHHAHPLPILMACSAIIGGFVAASARTAAR